MKYIKSFNLFESDNSDINGINRVSKYFLMDPLKVNRTFKVEFLENPDQQLIKDLLEYGLVDKEQFERVKEYINMPDEDLKYLVFEEINEKQPNLDLLKDLLEYDLFDFYITNDDLLNPLFYAIFQNQIEIVKLFLDYGADIESTDYYDNTPLGFALLYGNTEIAEYLIKRHAELNITIFSEDSEWITPLIQSIILNSYELVSLLLKKGVDYNQSDSENETPLHLAVKNNSEIITKFLIEYNAYTEGQDETLRTPLHWAVSLNNEIITKMLLDAMANVNVKDRRGDFPWNLASASMKKNLPQLKPTLE